MKSTFVALLSHVTSNKDNNFHINCPNGGESWCKFNSDGANNTSTYKPGPGLTRDIIYKIRPIYEDLTKESELEKCLKRKRIIQRHDLESNTEGNFCFITILTIWCL